MLDRNFIDHDLLDMASNGMAIGVGQFAAGKFDLFCNYPEAWQDTYFENDWMLEDPVVLKGLQQTGVDDWPELRSDGNSVMRAAADFGLVNGMVLSSSIAGNQCVAGLSTKVQANVMTKEHAIRIIREMHFDVLMAKAETLTSTQKDMVCLFANGLLAKQVAEIFEISANSVKQRKITIQNHIGVNSFMAVVNICARAGLTAHLIN